MEMKGVTLAVAKGTQREGMELGIKKISALLLYSQQKGESVKATEVIIMVRVQKPQCWKLVVKGVWVKQEAARQTPGAWFGSADWGASSSARCRLWNTGD